MKKRKSVRWTGVLLALVALAGCGTQETQEQIDQGKIEEYLRQRGLLEQAQRTPEGIYYLIERAQPDARRPRPEDIVVVRFTFSLLDGVDSLGATCPAEPTEFILGGFVPTRVTPCNTIPAALLTNGFQRALPYLGEGERATFLVPSRYAFGNRGIAQVPANTPVRYSNVVLEQIR